MTTPQRLAEKQQRLDAARYELLALIDRLHAATLELRARLEETYGETMSAYNCGALIAERNWTAGVRDHLEDWRAYMQEPGAWAGPVAWLDSMIATAAKRPCYGPAPDIIRAMQEMNDLIQGGNRG